MPTKLYIGNVPSAINSTELKELFEKYGKVLECDIVKDYAFVVSGCLRSSLWTILIRLAAYGRRQ